MPDLPGIEDFGGPILHTARWPQQDELDGAGVAVLGTGASAIQVVPALAARVGRLSVFQRTPAWTLPKHDRPWTPRRQQVFARVPGVQRAVRWMTFWQLESRVLAFTRWPVLMRVVEWVSKRHLRRSVSDPELRRRLTPHHTIGCKRILLSNEYWPTFERENVDLVTEPIERVEPGAVVTADGLRHEVEAIVLATGFDIGASLERIDLRGADGRSLREAWASGMRSNLGITVAGFPELYLLLGPNTGLGHSSVVLMSEFATRYVLACLERGRRRPRVVTERAQRQFGAEMRSRSAHTVWVTGCHSWYLDRFGQNTTLWPGSVVGYWWRTRRVDDRAFEPVGDVSSRPESAANPAATPAAS